MTLPIGLQLYSVRESAKKDFEGTIRRVAELGYVGVEPAGFPGTTPELAGKLFRKLGLAVPSAHSALPIGDVKNEELDVMDVIGCKRLVSGFGPDDFKTVDSIKVVCEKFEEARANAAERGIAVGYHNHWWEYETVGETGKLGVDFMLEFLSPEIFFEIDTYWVTVARQNAAETIARFGERVQLLHIKDGLGKRDEPMLAAGSGVMDFPSIVGAAKSADWLIVELDHCATDMMQAVAESIEYLASLIPIVNPNNRYTL